MDTFRLKRRGSRSRSSLAHDPTHGVYQHEATKRTDHFCGRGNSTMDGLERGSEEYQQECNARRQVACHCLFLLWGLSSTTYQREIAPREGNCRVGNNETEKVQRAPTCGLARARLHFRREAIVKCERASVPHVNEYPEVQSNPSYKTFRGPSSPRRRIDRYRVI